MFLFSSAFRPINSVLIDAFLCQNNECVLLEISSKPPVQLFLSCKATLWEKLGTHQAPFCSWSHISTVKLTFQMPSLSGFQTGNPLLIIKQEQSFYLDYLSCLLVQRNCHLSCIDLIMISWLHLRLFSLSLLFSV